MNVTENHQFLKQRDMCVLSDVFEQQVVCESGELWITVDGDARDFILQPSERFCTKQHRRAIIYALSPANVCIRTRSKKAGKVGSYE
jgi:hypothetical protein